MSFDFLQLLKPYFLGMLRHFAGAWAAYLAQRGYLSGDMVQIFTGAVMFLGTLGFSIADKNVMAALQKQVAKIVSPDRANAL